MAIKHLNPYIVFNGVAEKAIGLYEKALCAKVETLMRWGQGPEGCVAPEHKNLVMHSVLLIGGNAIMVADTPPGRPVPTDGNVRIALDFSDPSEMTKLFDALAEGGTVNLPIQDMFWGSKFGMLTDAFGVHWLFNCEVGKTGG